MIDWRSLAFNALWVVAAALALAAFSHATWEAPQRGESVRQALGRRGYQQVFLLAAVLFCIGQAGLSAEAWRLAAWVGLTLLSLGGLFINRRVPM